MEESQQVYPNSKVQTILIVAFSLISFVIVFINESPFSIQSLLLHNNISNDSSAPGISVPFTILEYELFLGIPLFAAIPTIIFGGILADVFGMLKCTVICSIICVFGVVIRAVGVQISYLHPLAVALLILGQSGYINGFYIILAIRNYVPVMYFENRWRPVVAGVMNVSARCGGMAAYLGGPHIGVIFGVVTAFWTFCGFAAGLVLISLILFAMLTLCKTSESFKVADEANRNVRQAVSLDGFSVRRVIGSFQPEFWVLLVASVCIRCISYVLLSNANEIHRMLFDINFVAAGINVAMESLSNLITSIVFGSLGGYTNQPLIFGFLGAVSALFSTLILMLQWTNPVLAYILGGISCGAIMTAIHPTVGNYVPSQFLGIAMSLMLNFANILIGMMIIVIGTSFTKESHEGIKLQWIKCLLFLTTLGVIATICMGILLGRDIIRRCGGSRKAKENEETTALKPTNSTNVRN